MVVARSCFVGMQIKCGGSKANLQCERNAYRTYVRTYLATGVSSASASSLDIPSMSTSVPNGAYTVGTAVTDGSDREADRQAGVGVHTQSDWLMRKERHQTSVRLCCCTAQRSTAQRSAHPGAVCR